MWWSIPFLIIFPMCIGALLYCIHVQKVRKGIAYIATPAIMAATIDLVVTYFSQGGQPVDLYVHAPAASHFITAGEIVLMFFVTWKCIKARKYWISLLSIVPTILIVNMEFGHGEMEASHIRIDHLSLLMCLIVAFVGGLITIYAMGYMDGYHQHHTEVPERRHFFFMVVYVFIGAMFGFVLSSDLVWIDFFWETTSVCSFLLIGYTQTEEAVNNSFRALWMNLLGGTALAFGIVYFETAANASTLQALVSSAQDGVRAGTVCVMLMAFAALTKAAQLPFSTWLIGAMVAPTPSSALLHSATMVKAGIYILFRLAPAMSGTMTGYFIAGIGGFTFFMTSIIAIGQVDAKKVLAYSTISNLGLMVACAGIGRPETLWAGVFLMMFHAISKSLMFQDVGATENCLHSRHLEDMHGLLYRLPKLATFMFIGIAGMYLAPFGMLISKWSALRASVDSKNVLVILFIVFGSATTSFYWSKWLGKIISRTMHNVQVKDITKKNEMVSLTVHAVAMVALCALFPVVSNIYVHPLLTETFGVYTDVLSSSVMNMLVVLILVVFLVPIVAYFSSRKLHTNMKLSYMNGANCGNDNTFTDSFGDPRKLHMANYYFTERIGRHALMVPCQLAVTATIIIMFCIVLGGVA